MELLLTLDLMFLEITTFVTDPKLHNLGNNFQEHAKLLHEGDKYDKWGKSHSAHIAAGGGEFLSFGIWINVADCWDRGNCEHAGVVICIWFHPMGINVPPLECKKDPAMMEAWKEDVGW